MDRNIRIFAGFEGNDVIAQYVPQITKGSNSGEVYVIAPFDAATHSLGLIFTLPPEESRTTIRFLMTKTGQSVTLSDGTMTRTLNEWVFKLRDDTAGDITAFVGRAQISVIVSRNVSDDPYDPNFVIIPSSVVEFDILPSTAPRLTGAPYDPLMVMQAMLDRVIANMNPWNVQAFASNTILGPDPIEIPLSKVNLQPGEAIGLWKYTFDFTDLRGKDAPTPIIQTFTNGSFIYNPVSSTYEYEFDAAALGLEGEITAYLLMSYESGVPINSSDSGDVKVDTTLVTIRAEVPYSGYIWLHGSMQNYDIGLQQVTVQTDGSSIQGNGTIGNPLTSEFRFQSERNITNVDVDTLRGFLQGLINEKADDVDLQSLAVVVSGLAFVQNITFNATTGILTWFYRNGSQVAVNIIYDQIFADMTFDTNTNELVITKLDGSQIRVNISSLVPVFTGAIGPNIAVEISSGVISATLLTGSVTLAQLDPTLQAMINSFVTQQDINDSIGSGLVSTDGVFTYIDGQISQEVTNRNTAISSAIAAIPPQVQSDWNVTTLGSPAMILNKPDLDGTGVIEIDYNVLVTLPNSQTAGRIYSTYNDPADIGGSQGSPATMASQITYNNTIVDLLTANNVQDAIDETAVDLYGNAITEIDITTQQYSVQAPRFDTWHIKVNGQVTDTQNTVDITFYDNPLLGADGRFNICTLHIGAAQIVLTYYDPAVGTLLNTVYLTDTSGNPNPSIVNSSYFPILQQFHGPQIEAFGNTVWYISSYADSGFNDPNVKSLMYFNVPILKQMIGSLGNLQGSQATLVNSINSALNLAHAKTQVFYDASGLSFVPDNSIGDPNDLYLTASGWWHKQFPVSGTGFTISGSTATVNNYNGDWYDMGVNTITNYNGQVPNGTHWFMHESALFRMGWWGTTASGYWVVDKIGTPNGFPPNSITYASSTTGIPTPSTLPPTSGWNVAGSPQAVQMYGMQGGDGVTATAGPAITVATWSGTPTAALWQISPPVKIAGADTTDVNGVPQVVFATGTDRLVTQTFANKTYTQGNIVTSVLSTGTGNPTANPTVQFGYNPNFSTTQWVEVVEMNAQSLYSGGSSWIVTINFGPVGSTSGTPQRRGTLYFNTTSATTNINTLGFNFTANGVAISPTVVKNQAIPTNITPNSYYRFDFQIGQSSNSTVYMTITPLNS